MVLWSINAVNLYLCGIWERYGCSFSKPEIRTTCDTYWHDTLTIEGVNDHHSLTLTTKLVAETRSKIYCPINDPDAILQIMFSGRGHISVNSKIIKHSSLCYLMGGIDLMKGRRLPPLDYLDFILVWGKWLSNNLQKKTKYILFILFCQLVGEIADWKRIWANLVIN